MLFCSLPQFRGFCIEIFQPHCVFFCLDLFEMFRCPDSTRPESLRNCLLPCKKDCIVTPFSEWTACPSTCMPGTQLYFLSLSLSLPLQETTELKIEIENYQLCFTGRALKSPQKPQILAELLCTCFFVA